MKGFGFRVFGFGPHPFRLLANQLKGAADERAPRHRLDPPPIRPASIRTLWGALGSGACWGP